MEFGLLRNWVVGRMEGRGCAFGVMIGGFWVSVCIYICDGAVALCVIDFSRSV